MNEPAIKLSVMSLGWGQINDEALFHSWIKQAKAAGYDGVSGFVDREFRLFLQNPDELASILDHYGLSLGSANLVGTSHDLEYIDRVCNFLRQMECTNLVVVGGKGKDEADFLRLADELNGIGGAAVRHGVHLVYHNHTHNTGETLEDMDKLLSLTDPRKVSVMLDTGHATVDFINQPTEERPLRFLEKYWERLTFIEFKDWNESAGLRLPLGEGVCNFHGIFQLLKQKHYQGWITVEFNGTDGIRTAKQYAAISREFIRGGMGI